MSDTTNPFDAMFDLQRTAVKQTQKATLDTIEAQQQAFEAMTDSVGQYGEFAEQNAEFTKNAWMAVFDSLEAGLPEDAADFDEARSFVEEQVDMTVDSQDEFVANLAEAMEESNAALDSYYDNYTEAVETAFENVLAGHEQLEESVSEATEDIDVTAA